MQIGSGAGLQPLALGTPCNLSLDFFAVSFHVSAYRYGGNNVQQLEAVRCGLGRLTTCVIWTITKKFPVPQIKPYIDSCAAVYYGDARNHWCQSRCYLGSTVKRWVSSRAQQAGCALALPPQKRETQHAPPTAGWAVKLVSLEAQMLHGLWWKISIHQTNSLVFPRTSNLNGLSEMMPSYCSAFLEKCRLPAVCLWQQWTKAKACLLLWSIILIL